jgi:SNF2 family DNA or RNA helicase
MIRFWVEGETVYAKPETRAEELALANVPGRTVFFDPVGFTFPVSAVPHLYYRFEDRGAYDEAFWAVFRAWERRIRGLEGLTPRDWPKAVATPWKHQQEAFSYLTAKLETRGAAALFSGMGTGKSRVAIALIADMRPTSVLIVCPEAMVLEWPDMFERDAPGLAEVVPLKGTPKKKAELLARAGETGKPVIYVTTYASVWREPINSWVSRDQPPDFVILDESQAIKAAGSKVSLFFRNLAADHPDMRRLIMTGTPAHDKPLDLYGQYRFLDATIFGNRFDDFRSRYAYTRDMDKYKIVTGYHDLEELTERMYEIAYRVESSILTLPERLPPSNRWVELGPKARKAYRDLVTDLAAEFQEGYLTIPHAATKLLRLQQVTSGYLPVVSYDEKTGLESETVIEVGDEKYKGLVSYLEELDPNEPVIVFCRFKRDLANIKRAAGASGRRYREQSGSCHQWREWQYDLTGGDVLGCQIQSGGSGVNLTRAAYVVYYSPDFSKGNYEQSQFRAYRPGQTRPVHETYLMARDSVDTYIKAALESKQELSALVMVRGILGDTNVGHSS